MLKYCDDLIIEVFALEVLNFINPNFENPDFEDPDSDASLNKQKVKVFAKKCRLTPKEFMNALDLVPRGELTITEQRADGEDFEKPLKLYSRIDSKNLIEIETAYIRYRGKNKLYEKGKAEIAAFLNPPVVQSTEEEKQKIRLKFLKDEFQRLQSKGEILGSVQYYDWLRISHENVKIGFVEKFMLNFVPEEHLSDERSKSVHLASSKKIIKKDLFLSFKETFVSAYITKMKLKDGTEKEWIEHWETLRKSAKKS
ncbi:hypothetical protein U9K52_08665 [Chryseobacterium sp. MHB01]|uniref:hypothetical protein n=1 Tax=Chryseobacterium sp. MHB01 TaxID=3109433 RepID=UPI002AFE6EAF|nr:hypothetical protein [Chryseobacterium sp. MHB01]MEA1848979.1 hypothetical protein [Chryseobacterium sp. MHB01]